MCYAVSFVVMPDKRVFSNTSPLKNSHTSILTHNKIIDNWGGVGSLPFTRVEAHPPGCSRSHLYTKADIKGAWIDTPAAKWEITFDDAGRGPQQSPDWWTSSHERALRMAIARWQASARRFSKATPAHERATKVRKQMTSYKRAITQLTTIAKIHKTYYFTTSVTPTNSAQMAKALAGRRQLLKKRLRTLLSAI